MQRESGATAVPGRPRGSLVGRPVAGRALRGSVHRRHAACTAAREVGLRGLRVLLLGRPRLELDGQALTAVMPAKQQALLYLLATEGQPLARGRATALLWGRHDEAAARANLRVALSHLRRWLPGLLAIDAREVAFAAEAPVTVDLVELEAAAAAGCEWPHERRAEAAEAWRGPPLEGFELPDADEFERWLQPVRQRATRAVQQLRAALAEACEREGDLEGALRHTRARLAVDDADEPAHVALMRLLAARGQRTAALAQFEVCRQALLDRLGARPSAESYALYTRIHADAPILRSSPARPGAEPGPGGSPGATVPADAAAPATMAAGVEHPPAPALPAAAPPSATNGPPPGAPAAPVGGLLGREVELALLAERLTDPACHWLTLTGPGGMGKTTLARACAARLGPRFRHGVLWLSGRDDGGLLRDAEAVLRRVFERCGDDHGTAGALLLVLDNLETVPTGAARALAPRLREHLPGVITLATSRRRLGDAHEWLLELGGLSLAPAPGGPPASSPAARLFLAAAHRPSPPEDAGEAGAVDEIAARLGGLPLALEQAGLSAQRLGVRALRAALAEGAAGGLAPVFDDAWSQLDPPTQAAALRLAALPAEPDLELAAVARVPAEAIETLRDHSWLRLGEGGQADRYAMHPLQQEYLRRRPECAAVLAEMPGRLAQALAERLPDTGPFGDGPAPDATRREPWRRLAAGALGSAAVLSAAADERLAHAEWPALQRWIDGAVLMLVHADRGAEAVALLDATVRRPDLPHWLAAGWRLRRAELHVAQGYGPGTFEAFLQPLAQLGLGGMRPDIVPTAPSLAVSWLNALHGRGWPAEPATRLALARLVQRTVSLLGQLLSFSPQPRGMARAAALSLAVGRQAGGGVARRLPWVMVGYGALFDGAPRVARAALRLGGDDWPLPANPALQAHTEMGAIVTSLALGRWPGLPGRLQACAEAYARIGNRRGEFEARSVQGKLAFYEGRLGDAERLFTQFDALALQHLGDVWQAWGTVGLAECGWALGGRDEAALRALLERATRAMTEIENIDNAYTLRRLGLAARLAWRRGDAATARDALAAAVASLAQVRRRGFWAHEGYAGVGEGLLAWLSHERRVGGPEAPVREAWRVFEASLRGHVARFPAGLALLHRLQGQAALADGDTRRARAALQRGLAAAERQGLRVELARCCEALGGVDGQPVFSERARALWNDMARGASAA